MKAVIIHLKKLDWILVAATLSLVTIGIVSIYSSSSEGNFLNFKKQIIFLIIGFFLMLVVSFFDWRSFRSNTYLVLILYSICLLGLFLLFFFAPEIRGARSWYKFGSFSLDPIEFTKIVLIILLAKYFSVRNIEMYRIQHVILSGLYVFFVVALVLLQPDFGSALILISLWVGILIISGIKIRHFLILIFSFLLIFALSWSTVLKNYQKERIINVFRPQLINPLEIGWNQAQSKIAIGSGGLLGQGIGKGSQTQHGFLPEPQTDFIFASIAEETGLAGISVILALFSLLIWRITKIAASATNNFSRLFAMGLNILIVCQIFINIGMNTGILPIIGIPLPFISYGGSGLISFFLALGVAQSVKIDQ